MAKELIIGDVRHELANTRRILERLPEEQLDWRPHAKSMTLGGLTTHLINLLNWQVAILERPDFDLATVPRRREALTRTADVLAEFDANAAKLEQLLAASDQQSLGEEWTLRSGDRLIMSQPRALALRTVGISHMVHHRAQLGVYLRLLDLPVPGFYGPSADEQVQ
ncbi:DinB family protein [Paenibacillus sp. GCM10023250]|uniref:DinB family protein n=1 Tax=Paenibacillus sp. GCM10023250 TaxID=3252648 RepID=UPI003621487E